MRDEGRQSPAFFEALYRAVEDPWEFASSAYELSRYDATLGALSQPIYRCAYEPGCSVGVLTAALAQRCGQVFACDIAPSAVAATQARCKHLPQVRVDLGDVSDRPAEGKFDLIVFSELGYYFPVARLGAMARRLASGLVPGGELIAVHWLGESSDHLLHGDLVHRVLRRNLPLTWLSGTTHPGFRIDSWRRP